MSDTYAATLMALGALALTGYAVKRASIGSRPLLQAVLCWLKDSHNERKQAIGGSRCQWCGLAFADLGSVGPMRTTFKRRHGEITRRPW